MKEGGYAGCFCSAREKSLPERVKAQICFELHSFEMVQHILPDWKIWSIFFSFFSDTGTSCTVLAMLSGGYISRQMYISREAILGTRGTAKRQIKGHSWLTPKIKGCRSISNYQSAEL